MFNIEPAHLVCISKNISLNIQNLLIIKENEKIHIAKKECEILQYLINNSQKAVSIEELSLNLWSYEESPEPATIRTYIKNLRKVLSDEMILNIRGVGYRFNKQ